MIIINYVSTKNIKGHDNNSYDTLMRSE